MQLQSHVITVLYGLPDIFQSSCTILNHHQQYMGDLVSLHPCHFLVLSQFSFSHSDHVRIAHWHYNLYCPSGWWLIVLNIFFCLLVICFLSGEVSLQVFAHFLIDLFVGLFVCLFTIESSLYILDPSLLLDVWLINNFSKFLWTPLFTWSFSRQKF